MTSEQIQKLRESTGARIKATAKIGSHGHYYWLVEACALGLLAYDLGYSLDDNPFWDNCEHHQEFIKGFEAAAIGGRS